MEVGETFILVPEPTKVPPQLPVYQFIPFPFVPIVPLRVVDCPAHIGFGEADTPVGTPSGKSITVKV